MIKQLFIIATFLLGLSSNAQISFYKTYDGSSFDTGEGVVQLPDSSYAITGGSGAFSINSGQAYLMLTDSLGEHLWTKSYGGDGSEVGRRIFHKPGQGFTIVGTTNTTTDGRYNFYHLRTDESGNLIEERNFGTENWDYLWDAVELPDGGLIMVGETEGETSSKKDMFIARVDNVGDTIWTKIISTTEDDAAKSVDILNDTTVVIGGYQWDGVKSSAVLISMHINGDQNWSSFYPGSVDGSMINDLTIDAGFIFSAGNLTLTGKEDVDWWLWKTDEEGNDLDELVGEFDRYDNLRSLCVVNDNVYIGLQSDSDFYNVYPEGVDAFVLKFHIDLFFNGFSQGYSGVNSDLMNQMVHTSDDGLVIAGTCGQERQNPTLSTSVMFIKIGPNDEVEMVADEGNDLVSISNETMDDQFKVYPNPTNGNIYIDGLTKEYFIQVYSYAGKLIYSSTKNSIVNLSNFDDGVYLLHISDGEHRSIRKIVKR